MAEIYNLLLNILFCIVGPIFLLAWYWDIQHKYTSQQKDKQ